MRINGATGGVKQKKQLPVIRQVFHALCWVTGHAQKIDFDRSVSILKNKTDVHRWGVKQKKTSARIRRVFDGL